MPTSPAKLILTFLILATPAMAQDCTDCTIAYRQDLPKAVEPPDSLIDKKDMLPPLSADAVLPARLNKIVVIDRANSDALAEIDALKRLVKEYQNQCDVKTPAKK